jgi:hypothetical protein
MAWINQPFGGIEQQKANYVLLITVLPITNKNFKE